MVSISAIYLTKLNILSPGYFSISTGEKKEEAESLKEVNEGDADENEDENEEVITYTLDFEKGTNIWNLYQAMQKKGIEDSVLDQEYSEIDYVKNKRVILRKQDLIIQKSEVLDYALGEGYEQFRTQVKEYMDYDPPWPLDDLDPNTTFDQEIMAKGDKAIAFFKDKLKIAGYKPEQDKYQERLAESIYNFAMFSKKDFPEPLKPSTPSDIPLPPSITMFAVTGGIEGADYIVKEGGLALKDIKDDCEIEGTALGLFKNGCGYCTELSSAIYSLFKRAGLKAGFIVGSIKKNLDGHAAVTLILSNKIRIFDPGLKSSNAEAKYKNDLLWWYPENAREFLSGYYSNLGTNYKKKGELEKALDALKKAVELDPNNYSAHLNLGGVYQKKGDTKKAAEELEKAVKINPNDAAARVGFGITLLDLSEKLFDEGAVEEGWNKLQESQAEADKAQKITPQSDENKKLIQKLFESIQQTQKIMQAQHPELK